MNRGVRMELVILKMVVLLTTLILMMGVMMVVMMEMVEMMVMTMEMMVMVVVMVTVMEEMVEVMVMTTMPHYWLRDGPWRPTMICRVMPTTTQSFSPLYTATTPGAPCSTRQSIGPTLTTPASGRRRCTSAKGVGCATSTVLSLHGSHMQSLSGMLLDRRWWSIVTATSMTSPGRRIVIFPTVGVASLLATLLHHLER